ncbi:Solute carrier family 12 member 7 [Hordeum vulgare]|nr:Solute carrier family 12 member 7 [Hordeum vulgare]
MQRAAMENGEIEAAEEGLPMPTPPIGRRYRPVGSDDGAVVQMTSMEPSPGGSTSVTAHDAVTPQPPSAQGIVKWGLFFLSQLIRQLRLRPRLVEVQPPRQVHGPQGQGVHVPEHHLR